MDNGPSINEVTNLEEEGGFAKGEATPYAYLIKWVTKGREGSKISKKGEIIYAWPIRICYE